MTITATRVPFTDERDWWRSIPAYRPESERRVEEIAQRIFTGVVLGGIAGMVVGPLRGAVIGVATICATLAQYVLQRPFTTEKRVLETLGKTSSSDPILMAAIAKLQKVFFYSKILLFQHHELHTFYKDITVITDKMITPQQKVLWKSFLDSLEGEEVVFLHAKNTSLCFSMQQERLEGKKTAFTVEKIDSRHRFFSKNFLQIVALEEECYPVGDRISAADLKRELRKRGSFCYVAREEESRKILGCLWGIENEFNSARTYGFLIQGLARKASFAQLGIGNRLMARVVHDIATSAIGLHVRESNEQAIALYQRWGFQIVKKKKAYYTHPAETALVMQRKKSF